MSDGPFRPRDLPPPPPQDAEEPPPARPQPRPGPARPPGRISSVTWIVGVAVVLLLAVVTINTVSTDAPGSRGVPVGQTLPPFAAPLVPDGPVGDAQVDRGKACDVRGPRILNACEMAERGPVAIAFVASRSRRCEDQVDVLDRLRARFPHVQMGAVMIRGGRAEVRRVVRRRGWRVPVAWDRDGAVANAYAVAICPTITFAHRGGKVAFTSLGTLDAAAVARRLEGLRR